MATVQFDPNASTAQGQGNYVSGGALGSGGIPTPQGTYPQPVPSYSAPTQSVAVLGSGAAKTDLAAKQAYTTQATDAVRQQQLAKIQADFATLQEKNAQFQANEANKLKKEELKIKKNESQAKLNATGMGGTDLADQADDLRDDIDSITRKQEKAYNDLDKNLNQIMMGTFPLSAYEQTLLSSMRASIDKARREQELANKNYQGGITQAGIVSGISRYSPAMAEGLIFKAVNVGIEKIQEIEAKGAEALAQLQEGFAKKRTDLINNSYEKLQDMLKEKKATVKEMYDEVVAQQGAIATYNREQKEQLEKDKSGILLTVAKNKAPADVRAAIAAAESYNDAINLAAPYLQSEGDILDIQYKKAQISKIYSDIAKDKADAALGGGLGDPALLVAYAQEYATNGKIPTGIPKGSFGIIAQVAKEMPKTAGEIVDTKTGVAPAQGGVYADGLASLYSAIELSSQLKELNDERWEGIVAGTVGKITGSDDQQRYLDLRDQIVDLLARARSGAALTTSEEKRFSDMLPGRFGEVAGFIGPDTDLRINNFTSTLSSDLKNKASAKGWAINGFSDVKVGDKTYRVGDIIQNEMGQQGRINADGSVTLIQ